MAHIGYGYGSEWHLLQYMGRRRDWLTKRVEELLRCRNLRWCDHRETRDDPQKRLGLREQTGLEFLPPDSPSRSEWSTAWPQTGNVPNWDAVGYAEADKGRVWVLVEAKAHTGELISSCGASNDGSRRLIRAFLDQARQSLGVTIQSDWLETYYQRCNRLGILHFLHRHGVKSYLLNIYFTGDSAELGSPGRDCPITNEGWEGALEKQRQHVGLPHDSYLQLFLHHVFLPAYDAKVATRILKPEYCRLRSAPAETGAEADAGADD